jgi:hypothetical protein
MDRRSALSRRNWIQSAAGAALAANAAAQNDLRVAGQPVEIHVTRISPQTVRLSIVPLEDGRPKAIPADGTVLPAVVSTAPTAKLRTPQTIRTGELRVQLATGPLSLRVQNAAGATRPADSHR